MALFQSQYRSPLAAQFWFFGLDARSNLLTKRGFAKEKSQELQGSSLYTLGPLCLHSSGVWLELPQGQLHIERRSGQTTLSGQQVPQAYGLQRITPHLLEHEAWIVQTQGRPYRQTLLRQYRPPAPIRRSLKYWRHWTEEGGLESLLWQPPQHTARAVEQRWLKLT